MKKLIWLLGVLALGLGIGAASAQGVYYSSNVTTAAASGRNGYPPVYAVPYAKITVCGYPATFAGSTCANTVPIYSDQALTSVISQPLIATALGSFGFWLASGTYLYTVQDASGNVLSNVPFSIGGSGGGGSVSESRYLASASCPGGSAQFAMLAAFDNNAPQLGCVQAATAVSAAGYMAFAQTASVAQYATTAAPLAAPAYWTGSDVTLTFYGASTSGNVGWIVAAGCTGPNGLISAVTYGTPQTLTTSVSSTANGLVTTATATGVAAPGTNGCAAGSLITYRITRSTTDTLASPAYLLGVTITTRRSQ